MSTADTTKDTVFIVRMDRRTRRLLDWLAREQAKRDGTNPQRARSVVVRGLIEREVARLETEQ